MLKRIATAVSNFLNRHSEIEVVLAVAILVCFAARYCGQEDSNTVDAEQQQILDTVERERDETAKKIELLESELTDLQDQVLALDEAIRASERMLEVLLPVLERRHWPTELAPGNDGEAAGAGVKERNSYGKTEI